MQSLIFTPFIHKTSLQWTDVIANLTCKPIGPLAPLKPRGPSSPFGPYMPCWPRGPGSPSTPYNTEGNDKDEDNGIFCNKWLKLYLYCFILIISAVKIAVGTRYWTPVSCWVKDIVIIGALGQNTVRALSVIKRHQKNKKIQRANSPGVLADQWAPECQWGLEDPVEK